MTVCSKVAALFEDSAIIEVVICEFDCLWMSGVTAHGV